MKAAVGGSDEERAMRKKKRKSKEDDRFNAVKSAIIKRLGDTCDVSRGLRRMYVCLNVLCDKPRAIHQLLSCQLLACTCYEGRRCDPTIFSLVASLTAQAQPTFTPGNDA